ncbi:MAG: hypothetical protein GY862_04960 [Gammaproteobacteria bacterium]|nr:hypothetical protein [Gammaproteobacteria bacterium]
MKNLLFIVIGAVLSVSPNTFAATPTDIAFATKKTAFLGGSYKIYRVRCSDGSKGKISKWKTAKPWCKGSNKKKCYKSQLKAANAVCR